MWKYTLYINIHVHVQNTYTRSVYCVYRYAQTAIIMAEICFYLCEHTSFHSWLAHPCMHVHPLLLQPILDSNGNGQLAPGTGLFLSWMGSSPCVNSPFLRNHLCGNLLFLVTGFNEKNNINMVTSSSRRPSVYAKFCIIIYMYMHISCSNLD